LGEAAVGAVGLSPRELDCLKWSARGKTYDEIGTILGIKRTSVKTYLDHCRHKLHSTSLQQATARAVADGWIAPKDLND
jgi:DNA-binding CsgD family transcriptional regulator